MYWALESLSVLLYIIQIAFELFYPHAQRQCGLTYECVRIVEGHGVSKLLHRPMAVHVGPGPIVGGTS